jgi:hypothetical protein
MNVKELIEILQTKDPEDLVLVSGYEGGFDTIENVETIEVCGPLNREWYYGKYDYCNNDELFKIKGLVLKK